MVDNRRDATIGIVAHKGNGKSDMSGILRRLNTDMWAILSAKAEGKC